jgi:hypothetical protein
MADSQNLHFSFWFDNDRLMIGARHVKFNVEINSKCTFTTKITNMVMVQNFEVISDKFIILGIRTRENYAQKWSIKKHKC